MRKGAIATRNARGAIERMASSNRSVKSNPPRQCFPAHGPKVLSTEAHDEGELDAIDVWFRENHLPIRKALLRDLDEVYGI
jgi:hypothetical protein